MKASDFQFEVGSVVKIYHESYNEEEDAVITQVMTVPGDASEVNEVELLFDDGSVGTYRPEDCLERET